MLKGKPAEAVYYAIQGVASLLGIKIPFSWDEICVKLAAAWGAFLRLGTTTPTGNIAMSVSPLLKFAFKSIALILADIKTAWDKWRLGKTGSGSIGFSVGTSLKFIFDTWANIAKGVKAAWEAAKGGAVNLGANILITWNLASNAITKKVNAFVNVFIGAFRSLVREINKIGFDLPSCPLPG